MPNTKQPVSGEKSAKTGHDYYFCAPPENSEQKNAPKESKTSITLYFLSTMKLAAARPLGKR